MKRFAAVLVALFATTLVLHSASAEEPATAPVKAGSTKPAKAAKSSAPKDAAAADQQVMLEDLQLDDAQKTKLAEATKARSAVLKAWDVKGEKGAKFEAAKAALAVATTAGDKAKIDEAQKAFDAIKTQKADELNAARKTMLDILTPQQQSEFWTGKLARLIAGPLKVTPALDAEQTKKIREIAAKHSGEFAKAEGTKLQGIIDKARKEGQAVLTAEQKATLPPPATKPAADAKAKPAAGAKAKAPKAGKTE